jgi:hypothetical protein
MKHFLLTAAFSMVTAAGTAMYAQTPEPQTPPSQQHDPTAGGQPTTITGCLMKGASPDQYVITENKSGQKLSFGGPSQLDKFLNQTVQLSGTTSKVGGEESFKPESIKSISASCQGGPAQK